MIVVRSLLTMIILAMSMFMTYSIAVRDINTYMNIAEDYSYMLLGAVTLTVLRIKLEPEELKRDR